MKKVTLTITSQELETISSALYGHKKAIRSDIAMAKIKGPVTINNSIVELDEELSVAAQLDVKVAKLLRRTA